MTSSPEAMLSCILNLELEGIYQVATVNELLGEDRFLKLLPEIHSMANELGPKETPFQFLISHYKAKMISIRRVTKDNP